MNSCFIYITNGAITNSKVIRHLFHGLQDGSYEVRIEPKKKRSLAQNAYMYGVLIPGFRDALYNAGYDDVKTDSQAKAIMQDRFLKTSVVNKETGEAIEFVKNTSDLTTLEMNVLFEDVWRFCADKLNYEIFAPNQQSTFNL